MLRSELRTRAARESGASAVEFALVLPILILLLFGITVFGINYNRSQGLQAAAREGARMASLQQSTVQMIQDRVQQNVTFLQSAWSPSTCPLPSNASVGAHCFRVSVDGGPAITSPTARPCNGNIGRPVKVEVQFKADVTVPLWKVTTVVLNGAGTFRCEA